MKQAFLILIVSMSSAKLPGMCLACLRNPMRQPMMADRLKRKKSEADAATTAQEN